MSTHNAVTAGYSDVLAAYNLCVDGDTLGIPAGDVNWSSQLSVTKNISIIGAGEGVTIIRDSLSRTGNPALFRMDLPKELAAPNYSFRISGMSFFSNTATALASDNAFIELFGISHGTDTPAPYVRGCVSRCRIDHITFTNMNGLCILVDSCLGVADHITAVCNLNSAPTFKVFMTNWTPDVDPATGLALPDSYLAIRAFGSFADDSYWGTDKFWFFEDCNFNVPSTALGICDDIQGGRGVYRHCTVTNGTIMVSHGNEGRAEPGVRAREIYNNYFITTKKFGRTSSGTVLYFNNRSTAMETGLSLSIFRAYATYPHWGAATGDCRYDANDGSWTPITGTITAVAAPGGVNAPNVTVGPSDDLSSIDLTDGNCYAIVDLDDPFTNPLNGNAVGLDNDPGWQFRQSTISSIAGKVLTIQHNTSSDSAHWAVGHDYKIMRTTRVYSAPGQGKGNLLNTPTTGGGGSYVTYTYPSTSGTKATTPTKIGQGGSTFYDLDPCYSWNNTDDTFGYLGLGGTIVSPYIKLGRDAINLSERTIETQNVGYPAVSYTRATSNWPLIGEDSDITYTPFTYPHPLTGATVGAVILLTGSLAFGNVIIGEAPTATLTVGNTGDELLTVTLVAYPTGFTGATTGFTVAAGATHDITVTFTPLLEQLYSGNITVTSDADSGTNTKAVSGTGVAPSGGGGGHGKGHKKGVLSRRV